jgi:hypothetical protein
LQYDYGGDPQFPVRHDRSERLSEMADERVEPNIPFKYRPLVSDWIRARLDT